MAREAPRPKAGDLNLDPNPRRGEKSNFRKISVTLPPIVYEMLIRESARRKVAGTRNQLLSALVREAVIEYLERLENEKN